MTWIAKFLDVCADGPKMCWIEAHPGFAGYLQGAFSILAILAAIGMAWRQGVQQRKLAKTQGDQQRQLVIDRAVEAKKMQLFEARAIGLLIRGKLDVLKRDAEHELGNDKSVVYLGVPLTIRDFQQRI